MKNPLAKIILIWLSLLSFSLSGPAPAATAEPGCIGAAEAWITALDDAEHREVLQRYTRNTCEFSGHWIRQYAGSDAPVRHERMCQDLVLLWAHKECNYLRDTFNPAADDPCKAWSREMHRRCLADDVTWFP